MGLTVLAIKALKPKETLYRVADQDGLCLEVTPTGSKLWRWRYRFNGKGQMLALGKFPDVGPEEARKRSQQARELLAAGKHPTREKKASRLRQSIAGEHTFEKVARTWLAVKGKGMKEHYNKLTISRMEQHVFPHIGALPLTEIKIPDVARVIEKIGARGTIETAHRMKQLISQTFRYASQRGLCEHNPAADMRDLLPSAEERHHACIEIAEFPELLRKMASYRGDPMTIAALHLLSLTFVRTGELIQAKWSEIDFDRAEWRIPKERMKMKRPHTVPLSRQAIEYFRQMHLMTGDKEHVFHSQRGKSKHISNGTVLMALRRLGYKGRMTGHGFRALASSILNQRGYSPDVIERQLAHGEEDKVRGAYSYLADYMLERRKMMQDYADLLDDMRDQKTAKIIPLSKVAQ